MNRLRRSSSKTRVRGGVLATAMAAGALLLTLGVAAPASAAPNCGEPRYSGTSGIANVSCTGSGQMRFKVSCHAHWPYESWTKYSSWATVTNGGQNMAASFPGCGYASSVWVQYP